MRYQETQRFGPAWLWIPILGSAGVMWYGIYEQLVRGRPFGTNPAPDAVLIGFWALVGIGMPWAFAAANLRTEVRDDGLHVRYFPFHLRRGKHWRFDEIAEAYPRDYAPIREYGGWGIRLGWRGNGRAYNAAGNRGVQLVLRDGSRVLIGSQFPERLALAIRAGMPGNAGSPPSMGNIAR